MKIDKKNGFRLLLLAFFAIGVYGILPQIGDFKGSLHYVSTNPVPPDALFFSLMTFVFAALVYCSLAIKPLGVGRTFVMQLSAMFVNKLLPAGVGALGMNAAYLHKQKHSLTQSGVIVGLNNIIGLIGHAILFAVAYIFWRDSFYFHPKISTKGQLIIEIGLVAIVLAAIFVLKKQSKERIKNFKKQLRQIAGFYGEKPWKLGLALLCAMGITLSFTLCLWASLHSVYLTTVTVPGALLLLTLGVGAGTAVPTPGGIGGTEAGIYAGLIAMNQDPKQSFAGVLIFRIVSYWVPLLLGFFAFIYSQKKKWFGFKSESAQSDSQRKR